MSAIAAIFLVILSMITVFMFTTMFMGRKRRIISIKYFSFIGICMVSYFLFKAMLIILSITLPILWLLIIVFVFKKIK
jgi:hypothetical protein